MLALKTKRLILRHFQHQDIDAIMFVFGDAEVMNHGDGVQSKEQVEQWMENTIYSYKVFGFGPYAVVLASTQTLIGYCGLFHFPDIDGQPEVEIGYRLAKQYWGQGFATEAALAVREYAFKTLEIGRVVALIEPSNTASIRVATKLGMSYEKDVMLNGYSHPDRLYVIANQETRPPPLT